VPVAGGADERRRERRDPRGAVDRDLDCHQVVVAARTHDAAEFGDDGAGSGVKPQPENGSNTTAGIPAYPAATDP
jgi:hypothetical protein